MRLLLPRIVGQVDETPAPRQQACPVDRTTGNDRLIDRTPDSLRRAVVASERCNDLTRQRAPIGIFLYGIDKIAAEHRMGADFDKNVMPFCLQSFNSLGE